MKSLMIIGGYDKSGQPEPATSVTLHSGELYTIVGNTGSGKSRLIKDIENLVNKDSITNRQILLDKRPVNIVERNTLSTSLISHLSQNMRFILDSTVEEFLSLHAKCRSRTEVSLTDIIDLTNTITPEPVDLSQNLNTLSGGQSRALMIADIACICDSPIVLIDEIENAGIHKTTAFQALIDHNKLVLIVTHDPHTALMAKRRIIMKHGAIQEVIERNELEEGVFKDLEMAYEKQFRLQTTLRRGEYLS